MARAIDADVMLAELKPIDYEAEHSAVLISDVAKIMREWVERQPTLTPQNDPLTLEYREYRCAECGHGWMEDCDATDYPNYCPGCGNELRRPPEGEADA